MEQDCAALKKLCEWTIPFFWRDEIAVITASSLTIEDKKKLKESKGCGKGRKNKKQENKPLDKGKGKGSNIKQKLKNNDKTPTLLQNIKEVKEKEEK